MNGPSLAETRIVAQRERERGVDRFISECRSLTDFIGNGVATIVVSKWEGELDSETLRRELSNRNETDSAGATHEHLEE